MPGLACKDGFHTPLCSSLKARENNPPDLIRDTASLFLQLRLLSERQNDTEVAQVKHLKSSTRAALTEPLGFD